MANLADLLANNSTPELTYVDNPPDPLIEPLDGYATVDQIMDRFPEEVYNQSQDSHLYLFLQALCGDSGAGILKKQSYIGRLKTEASLLVFSDLDTQYTQVFTFPRLPDEEYTQDLDPDTDVLTKTEWDSIQLCDDRYRNRIKLFFQATRLGNSPAGITMAAEAGSGIQCDVWENYKAYYDLISDDPLGLQFMGITNSIHEYVVIPRIQNADGSADASISYTSTLARTPLYTQGTKWAINTSYSVNQIVYPIIPNGHFYEITAQTGNSGVTEPDFADNTLGQTFVQGNITYLDIGVSVDDYDYNITGNNASGPTLGTYTHLDPAIEYNMIHTLDELRPVGALMTIEIDQERFIAITDDQGNPITPYAASSSESFQMTRFVTGAVDVNWPDTDTDTGEANAFWIQPGIENEQVNFPLVTINQPVIWETVDNAHAYTEAALSDPAYGTTNFYGGTIPVWPKYRSEHLGSTTGDFALVFPFIQNAPSDDLFASYKAVSLQTTPLILTGRGK